MNHKGVAKRVLAFVEASQFHLVETAEHVAMLIIEQFGVQGQRGLEQARRDPQFQGRGRQA